MEYEVVFETDRIKFIKVNENLVDDYLNMINDPDVQKFICKNRFTLTKDQEFEWIKKNLENNLIFTMIEKETNEFIGNIEIMKIHDGIGELGISITKDKQNMHYGQEAINKIIDYAFNELNLDELELNVYATNPRGIACYEKVGFVRDGVGKRDDDIHMILPKIKLIPYTDDDYDFVYDVKKNVYKKYVEECWGPWNEEVQRKLFQKFIDDVKNNAYIIMNGNKKIGFYNGKVLDNGNYEIGNICIIPEYQGKGIGTKILKDKLEEYKDRDIEIQYFKQNPVGKLYERLGFVLSGETEFHYQMTKPKQEILRK